MLDCVVDRAGEVHSFPFAFTAQAAGLLIDSSRAGADLRAFSHGSRQSTGKILTSSAIAPVTIRYIKLGLTQGLDGFLERDRDRGLFDLDPKAS